MWLSLYGCVFHSLRTNKHSLLMKIQNFKSQKDYHKTPLIAICKRSTSLPNDCKLSNKWEKLQEKLLSYWRNVRTVRIVGHGFVNIGRVSDWNRKSRANDGLGCIFRQYGNECNGNYSNTSIPNRQLNIYYWRWVSDQVQSQNVEWYCRINTLIHCSNVTLVYWMFYS